ncbi:hypothetical protein RYH73_08430 [Olivibacter sp. CPCC 100613]|uniref:beta-xylosidase family glycoside hydrolase n=1 Tax=Olivibacter sp. CPCC 100613 TaxID=3079931 RepID=UPI002FF4A842
MMIREFIICLLLFTAWSTINRAQEKSASIWQPDQGNGTYKKPVLLQQVFCKNALEQAPEKIVAEQYITSDEVYLQVRIQEPDAGCRFFFSEDGKNFKKIGESFFALPDKWIGAKVGLFSIADANKRLGGYADFDWFRIE